MLLPPDKVVRALGLGAGGHARILVEAILLAGGAEIVGLLDRDPAMHGMSALGIPILGGDELLAAATSEYGATHFFNGVGGVGSNRARRSAFERALAAGLQPLTVIHPGATVSPSAVLAGGAILLAGAIVVTGARIGANALVNTGAIVEHDCTVEDHAHVSTGARLAGNVVVGEGAHVGVGASVRQGVSIGAGAIVGAGAAVVADVPPGVIVVGVPAKKLRSIDP